MQKLLLLALVMVAFQNGGGRLPDHIMVIDNIETIAMADK